jgi:23S rRNA pseudouridine2604 synthase
MGFTKRIKYFLVHQCTLGNKEAAKAINDGRVRINGSVIHENVLLKDEDEVLLDDVVVRKQTEFIYLKFYKPSGYESTLNEKVQNNLSGFFREFNGLSIAGRLDKDSEGLLLLGNDGKWVQKIMHPQYKKDKEYIVEVDREVNEDLIRSFRNGIRVGKQEYQPAFCEQLNEKQIRIILREGKNRQIRNVCRKLNYNVLQLKRVRMDNIILDDMKPGEIRFIHF